MKAIVQRVLKASVTVDGKVVSSIGQGLCVLVGISRHDTAVEIDWLVRKILNLRLFDGESGKKWDKSVMDKQYEILCVSQFTLAVTLKGNKPDFHEAMGPEFSQDFYNEFLKQMGENYSPEKIKVLKQVKAALTKDKQMRILVTEQKSKALKMTLTVDYKHYGEFGAYMHVDIENDGPVTIPLESPVSLKDDPKLQKKFNNPRKGNQAKKDKPPDSVET